MSLAAGVTDLGRGTPYYGMPSTTLPFTTPLAHAWQHGGRGGAGGNRVFHWENTYSARTFDIIDLNKLLIEYLFKICRFAYFKV